jgi:hypothetical protein
LQCEHTDTQKWNGLDSHCKKDTLNYAAADDYWELWGLLFRDGREEIDVSLKEFIFRALKHRHCVIIQAIKKQNGVSLSLSMCFFVITNPATCKLLPAFTEFFNFARKKISLSIITKYQTVSCLIGVEFLLYFVKCLSDRWGRLKYLGL